MCLSEMASNNLWLVFFLLLLFILFRKHKEEIERLKDEKKKEQLVKKQLIATVSDRILGTREISIFSFSLSLNSLTEEPLAN